MHRDGSNSRKIQSIKRCTCDNNLLLLFIKMSMEIRDVNKEIYIKYNKQLAEMFREQLETDNMLSFTWGVSNDTGNEVCIIDEYCLKANKDDLKVYRVNKDDLKVYRVNKDEDGVFSFNLEE